jgi:hypothetical protein
VEIIHNKQRKIKIGKIILVLIQDAGGFGMKSAVGLIHALYSGGPVDEQATDALLQTRLALFDLHQLQQLLVCL